MKKKCKTIIYQLCGINAFAKQTLLTVSVLFLASCSSEKDNINLQYGQSLYPQITGREIIYDVDSFVYDDFKQKYTPDTFHFQIKELIESKFTDQAGINTNRIVQYKRKNDSAGWEMYKVISSNLSEFGMEKTEDNFRYIKLAFPVKKNKSWNGNAYNILGRKDYEYTSTYETKQIGNFLLDSTVTVLQGNDSNAIVQEMYKEIYAAKIGMVYKQWDSVGIGSGSFPKGLKLRYTLKKY